MFYLLAIAVVVLIIGTLVTISVSKENDENYGKKSKSNVMRLTSIYVVVVSVSLVILGFYIAKT
ncbi:hypothetical protein M670_02463 [Schinkia azotoformans MEV2011]|uniref:Group-specific protein n=2 Tax=Schinkia azotoformans TaxID=1454 RepID=K6DRR5_SCHAZ|nr:hypothetical protein [Schinkia azotoformans]EKN63471.1 hypothetical protein BAZO_17404 [Schinkia azotoformans LMG 9581]KEF38419.1 hypothetical protein M670_02463 [Schinkia azotoformans MEV2011]MEC1638770.1 hypothetical protein [Schinkia azotoformans]MEC1694161.1 hypothetical protein [Schinkia azotoformans]MEC1715873.1 hypothetical protein [Schinkia azotoformans]